MTTTNRTRAARWGMVGALLAGSLALTGCAEAPPAPTPDASAQGPILTPDAYNRILEQVSKALSAANESKDPAKLTARLTGPALKVRTSQVQVAAALGKTDFVTEIPSTYLQLMVSDENTWPRSAFAITQRTESLGAPRFLVLTQDSPRAPFKLWGWVQLRPGITMPRFADIKLGSEILAADDDSLKVKPKDVIAQYADVITLGDQSAFVKTFEAGQDDPFRSLIATTTQTQTHALEPDNPQQQGTYTFTFTPTPNTPVKTIRTADGGAVVFGALDGTEAMAVVQGATIGWPDGGTTAALLSGKTKTNHLVQGFSDMIALYVPPAGSDQPVKLLGYSHVQTSASVDAPAAG